MYNIWPLSANIFKSTRVFIFFFQEIFPSIVHILITQIVSMYHQLYFQPPLSCFHAHLLASSHIAAEPTWAHVAEQSLCDVFRVLCRRARKLAEQYKRVYNEQIPTAQLVQRVATVMQEFTQSGSVRWQGENCTPPTPTPQQLYITEIFILVLVTSGNSPFFFFFRQVTFPVWLPFLFFRQVTFPVWLPFLFFRQVTLPVWLPFLFF